MDLRELRDKAMHLPLKPGVYIMKNVRDEIIYIGKAKALKNRVSQYFGSDKNHPEKVRRMVENVDHFDYILCASEFEALVLECSLIKQHKPKYNILLKDDKGYSYIRISNDEWRKISFEMQKKDDGAVYLGPYMSAWYAKNSVEEAKRIFRLPSCEKNFPKDIGKGRPCLNYHIKQCDAPCSGRISKQEYDESVDAAINFLKSGNTDSIRIMTEKMNKAAENLEFELAAKLRDRINVLKKITEKQNVVAANIREQDAIAVITEEKTACFAVIRFKDGRLYDKEDFIFSDSGDDPDLPAMRSEFIKQYYSMRDNIPPVISLDGEAEDEKLLAEWLSQKKGKSVKINHPQKGENMRIIEMSRENAAERLAQSHGHLGHELTALDELAKLLGLSRTPRFIESYDISHHAGSDNVAGMVVFKDGRPFKSSYRKFSIKGFSGQNDYASMAEVLTRRFQEYFKSPDSGSGFGQLPDLILLDGGKGQVSAVRPVLESFGLDIPLFGMVKDNHHRTRAITDEGHEIAINSKRRAFTLVSGIQDEVHRFAISYHRSKHSKRSFSTGLTEIDGIGPTRAKALLKRFKTIARIKQAEIEELMKVKEMTMPVAEAVYKYYHPDNEDDLSVNIDNKTEE